MQNYSVITKVNKNLDKQVCRNFIGAKIDDFDFGKERIIDLHSELRKVRIEKNKKRKNKFINDYLDNYYKNRRREIFKAKKFIFGSWQETEQNYFREVIKLFNNKVYLKNKKFIAFLSIFSCSPLVEPQGWQIYYKIKDKKEIRRIFAHEILHFFYYDYIKNNRQVKPYYDKLNQNELWIRAELFNVAALNQDNFRKIIGKKEKGYDIHKKYFGLFKRSWRESKSLDDYLTKVACLKLE